MSKSTGSGPANGRRITQQYARAVEAHFEDTIRGLVAQLNAGEITKAQYIDSREAARAPMRALRKRLDAQIAADQDAATARDEKKAEAKKNRAVNTKSRAAAKADAAAEGFGSEVTKNAAPSTKKVGRMPGFALSEIRHPSGFVDLRLAKRALRNKRISPAEYQKYADDAFKVNPEILAKRKANSTVEIGRPTQDAVVVTNDKPSPRSGVSANVSDNARAAAAHESPAQLRAAAAERRAARAAVKDGSVAPVKPVKPEKVVKVAPPKPEKPAKVPKVARVAPPKPEVAPRKPRTVKAAPLAPEPPKPAPRPKAPAKPKVEPPKPVAKPKAPAKPRVARPKAPPAVSARDKVAGRVPKTSPRATAAGSRVNVAAADEAAKTAAKGVQAVDRLAVLKSAGKLALKGARVASRVAGPVGNALFAYDLYREAGANSVPASQSFAAKAKRSNAVRSRAFDRTLASAGKIGRPSGPSVQGTAARPTLSAPHGPVSRSTLPGAKVAQNGSVGVSGASVHVVKHGDTLWDIAKKNNTTVSSILRANPTIAQRRSDGKTGIFSGTKVRIPKGK